MRAQPFAGSLSASWILLEQAKPLAVLVDCPAVPANQMAAADDSKPLAAQVALDPILISVVGHLADWRVVDLAVIEAADGS